MLNDVFKVVFHTSSLDKTSSSAPICFAAARFGCTVPIFLLFLGLSSSGDMFQSGVGGGGGQEDGKVEDKVKQNR